MVMEVKVREEAMNSGPARPALVSLWLLELCVGHGLRGWRAGLQCRSCPSGCVTLGGSPDPSRLHFPSFIQGDRSPWSRQP